MLSKLETPRTGNIQHTLAWFAERDRLREIPFCQRDISAGVKIAFDRILAALLLILSAPILFICMILIRLTSRGPALYSQLRLGRGGRPYRIYKLRSMYHLCEAQSGPQWSQSGDPRVTPLGRVLRRTHLDELPQLWNILKGEMSLVGPRPERPEFIQELTKVVPLYELRMMVRPGVTGLAQVQVPADIDMVRVRIKVAYDLHYIQHASLWLDLRILLATAFKVVGGTFNFSLIICRFPVRPVVESGYQDLQQRFATAALDETVVDLVPTPSVSVQLASAQ